MISQKTLLSFCILLLFTSCSIQKHTGFTDREKALIMSGEANEPMRVLKITDRQDSLFLRKNCTEITADPNDEVMQRFAARLVATLHDSASLGVGIAAPQVGIGRRIICVQRFDKEEKPFEVYVNPVVIKYSDSTQTGPEGCLSIPDRRENVKRAACIDLEYDYPNGSHHKENIKDFTAVIFQHEIDHLDGILYIDHLEKEVRDEKVPNGKRHDSEPNEDDK